MKKSCLVGLALTALVGPACFSATQSGWDPVKGPAGAWVYIVLGGYETAAPRIESAASSLGPNVVAAVKNFPAEMRKGLAEEVGIAGDAVDLSKPLAIAVFNPMMGEEPAVLVPVKGEASSSADVINGYLVASDSETVKSRVQAAFKGAGGLSAPKGIGRMYVDLGTIYQIFAPMLQMQMGMAMSQVPGGNAQAGMAAMDVIFSILGQVENFTIDLDVAGQTINALVEINAKQGTDIAQLCANQTGGSTLGSLVKKEGVWVSGKINGAGGWVLRLTDRMLDKVLPNPAEADAVRGVVRKFMGKTADELTASYRFTPDGLAADAAMAFTGTMADVREYYTFLASEKVPAGLKQLMTSGATGVTFTFTPNVRQSGGVAVDNFKTDYSAATGLDPMVKQQIEALWGGGSVNSEYALVNGTWLVTMGGKDPSKRLDDLIAKAQNPEPGAPQAEPLKASVDLLQLAGFMMKAAGLSTSPALTKGGPPATATVTFAGRTVTKRVTVPLETIGKIKKMVEDATGSRSSTEKF